MNPRSPDNQAPERGRLLKIVLLQVAFTFLFLAFMLFLPARTIHWWAGWVILGLFVTGNFGALLVLIWINPELAKERVEVPGKIRRWDRLLTAIPKLLLFLVILPLAGFDHRFGWSQPFPVGWQIAGLAAFALTGGWVVWAMLVNRFFAASVRIQTERGHTVCASGPYRWVRHPGYAGWIIQFITVPLALEAWWIFIPSVLAAGCYVIRTALEDQTLQQELPGYIAYAQKVRFRLLPGIW